MRPAAVLWDLDGTLVDSEPLWIEAERALAKEHGGTWTTAQGEAQVGRHASETALALQTAGVELGVSEIVEALTADVLRRMVAPRWRPGAYELLVELRDAGVRCALVTSSPRPIAEVVWRAAPEHTFEHVISGSDVTVPKPDPEPYLLALRRLEVSADVAVAVEDSPTGIASATAAGLRVIAVPFLADTHRSTTWRWWPTLAGRSLTDFEH